VEGPGALRAERNTREDAPDLCGAGRRTVMASDGARRRVRLVAERDLGPIPLEQITPLRGHGILRGIAVPVGTALQR